MRGTIFHDAPTRLGAPPKGVDHVDATDGSAHARARAKTLLRLVAGELTRAQAAAEMDVSVRRVRQLRDAMLSSAVAALEPGRPGRPPKAEPSPAERRVDELEAARERLRWEIEVSGVREEIALVLPHLVRGGEVPGKTGASRKGSKGSAGRRRLRG